MFTTSYSIQKAIEIARKGGVISRGGSLFITFYIADPSILSFQYGVLI